MRVLLCFGEQGGVTRMMDLPVVPRKGEFLETGLETWLIERVTYPLENAKYEAKLCLKKASGAAKH